MKVLTEVGEINNVVIMHKGTGYKYRRIVGNSGYRGYREAMEEDSAVMIEIEDMAEIDAMIRVLFDFREMMLDTLGIWEPRRLKNREAQGCKEKMVRRRKR